ncbi:hypothetical protein OAD54_01670 [Candidatus Pelagibacter sp.]|nr:hypothetical protein [Candidatus Pelagibacter sp.]
MVNTTNVTASGALMDSELTDITAIKALDQGVATTDSPTFAEVTASSLVVNGNNYPSAGALSSRNKVINGDMGIDQRNAGGSVAVTTNGAFWVVDRFRLSGMPASGVFTGVQSTDAPAGFSTSLKLTVTAADANVTAADAYYMLQLIEGYNVRDLNLGTANAKTITLSFWAKSSVTGSFGGSLSNDSVTRSYPFSYTISVANTWEYKTVTIAGDTTGTWLINNGKGLRIYWGLGTGTDYSGTGDQWNSAFDMAPTGSVNWISTAAATFYITGVQLEVGDTATPFEHRSYGQELALCQRYFYIPPQGPLHIVSSGKGIFNISPPVQFRATPTASIVRTNPYVENVPWTSVGTVSGIGLDSGHLNEYGGDLLLFGTYVQAHSYGDIWILGPNELSIDAEL